MAEYTAEQKQESNKQYFIGAALADEFLQDENFISLVKNYKEKLPKNEDCVCGFTNRLTDLFNNVIDDFFDES